MSNVEVQMRVRIVKIFAKVFEAEDKAGHNEFRGYSWLYCVCRMVFSIAQKFSMGVSNWT